MSFRETIEALDAEEKAKALADEHFQKSKIEWEEILACRAALRPAPSDGDGGTLTQIVGLVRRHGPKASKYLGYPGLATAITAATMAEEGTFTGPLGAFSLIGQIFGIGVGP